MREENFLYAVPCVGPQVKDTTLKKIKALEEQKDAVETERDALKVRIHADKCFLPLIGSLAVLPGAAVIKAARCNIFGQAGDPARPPGSGHQMPLHWLQQPPATQCWRLQQPAVWPQLRLA